MIGAPTPKPTPIATNARQTVERAQLEFERGRLGEVIDLLERALALGVDDVHLRTMLGIAYARTRQIGRAFEHLERGLGFDPEAFGPRCALGELYLRLAVPEVAREHLYQALESAGENEERAYVVGLLREERARDRRHIPRPRFRQPICAAGRSRR
jgi:tetratricopeptide (TPR) repeat protein